eukprot:16172-Heterococcus_DN1.PRE.1
MASEAQQQAQAEFDRADSQMKSLVAQMKQLGVETSTTAQALRLCVKETKGLAIQKVRLQWADDAHAAQRAVSATTLSCTDSIA